MKKVLFRADASGHIGAGHVMRCLTLANALREQRVESVFACSLLPRTLAERIESDGHSLAYLDAPDERPSAQIEAAWSVDAQMSDALDCLRITRDNFDWVVVDHYGLDSRWHGVARRGAARVMVIDDLANRQHDCDLLLDHNFGRIGMDYEGLVPPSAGVLAGVRYALLRPEFARLRAASLSRRPPPKLRRILVSIGAADPQNLTGRILESLDAAALPKGTELTVVVGALSPFRDQVIAVARDMRTPTRVLFDVSNMAELMVESDLAIGGGGATAWERCCLGLPSIVLILSDNQRAGAEALHSAGCAIAISATASNLQDQLGKSVKAMSADGLRAFTKGTTELGIDGLGADRVAQNMLRLTEIGDVGRLRKVEAGDLDLLLEWRNSARVRSVMFTQNLIAPDEHRRWFDGAANNDNRRLMIFELRGRPTGFINLRFEWPDRRASWGFYKAPDAPRGAGRRMCEMALRYAFEQMNVDRMEAQVMAQNDRSNRLHLALGFRRRASNGAHPGAICYELQKHDWAESVGRQAENE